MESRTPGAIVHHVVGRLETIFNRCRPTAFDPELRSRQECRRRWNARGTPRQSATASRRRGLRPKKTFLSIRRGVILARLSAYCGER
jgi:hypothetical protein